MIETQPSSSVQRPTLVPQAYGTVDYHGTVYYLNLDDAQPPPNPQDPAEPQNSQSAVQSTTSSEAAAAQIVVQTQPSSMEQNQTSQTSMDATGFAAQASGTGAYHIVADALPPPSPQEKNLAGPQNPQSAAQRTTSSEAAPAQIMIETPPLSPEQKQSSPTSTVATQPAPSQPAPRRWDLPAQPDADALWLSTPDGPEAVPAFPVIRVLVS